MHRTPGQREAQACLPWLQSEIAAVQPKAIVALGAVAARSLMGGAVSVLKAAGEWEILKVNQLDDECFATPAIADGRIYIRTRSALFCFGIKS